jgi:hypothetical protein
MSEFSLMDFTPDLSGLLHRVLRINDDVMEFSRALYRYHQTDPEGLRFVESVCARLDFIERLRANRPTDSLEHDILPFGFDLDRLTSYLSVTCIDVVARDKYKAFPQWLEQASKDLPGHPIISEAFQELGRSGTATINEAFVWATKRIFEGDYAEIAGMRRGFRRFFASLPVWLKHWLGSVYFIVNGELLIASPDLSWLTIDDEEKCKRIALYLYEVRNYFTHTVEHHPDFEGAQKGSPKTTINRTSYRFQGFYPNGDFHKSAKRYVGLQVGLAESAVLRLLVVIVLRELLGLENNPKDIDAYWNWRTYRETAFGFVNELRANRDLLGWLAVKYFSFRQPHHESEGLPFLEFAFASEFLTRHEQLFKTKEISLYSVDGYIQDIGRINEEIEKYNRSFKGPDFVWGETASEYRGLIQQIVDSPEAIRVNDAITDIEMHLVRRMHTGFS